MLNHSSHYSPYSLPNKNNYNPNVSMNSSHLFLDPILIYKYNIMGYIS